MAICSQGLAPTCIVLVSSPEHKVLIFVLRVSYCDHPMSSVQCPSSAIVNNFFKRLLLLNHWANLDEIWRGCFLGEALHILCKEFNSMFNSGYHGNLKGKKSKIFENLLV